MGPNIGIRGIIEEYVTRSVFTCFVLCPRRTRSNSPFKISVLIIAHNETRECLAQLLLFVTEPVLDCVVNRLRSGSIN